MVVVVSAKMLLQLLDRPRCFRAGMDVVKALVEVLTIANNIAMMRESNGKEGSDVVFVQFVRWQRTAIGRRPLPIVAFHKFVTWQVMNCSVIAFVTWQVMKFVTYQVMNFGTSCPSLIEQAHKYHAA